MLSTVLLTTSPTYMWLLLLLLAVLFQPVSGTVSKPYPPVAITAATSTVTAAYGSGPWVLGASSSYSGSTVKQASDKSLSSYYHFGLTNYNQYTGIYVDSTPSITTLANGTSFAGDWYQWDMPSPILVTDLKIVARQDSCCTTTRAPRNFVLLGGTSCLNWNLILRVSNYQSWTTAAVFFPTGKLVGPYDCYRVVTTRVGNFDYDPNALQNTWNMAEIELWGYPMDAPSSQPTSQPSRQPSRQPTSQPSRQPSRQPTSQPSRIPSRQPSSQPSRFPTSQPVQRPSGVPTGEPSRKPTSQPVQRPSGLPTGEPSRQPSSQPVVIPTMIPSAQPQVNPTSRPSTNPSALPSAQPVVIPTSAPSVQPSVKPSSSPTKQPTSFPTRLPTGHPTNDPTGQPSTRPSSQPFSYPSNIPSSQPISSPTSRPSNQPTSRPSNQPTSQPISNPTCFPTSRPSRLPSCQPSSKPSTSPSTKPSNQPSAEPSSVPSVSPSTQPSNRPTSQPSLQPSSTPTIKPTTQPSAVPSAQPSKQPSMRPTTNPTARPSSQPSDQPSTKPSIRPTRQPSSQPSSFPSVFPSSHPTTQPSRQPTSLPTTHPTAQPAGQPSVKPSMQPTNQPSVRPSMQPSTSPSSTPSSQPSALPTSIPSELPSSQPSQQPSTQPSTHPTNQPSTLPTVQPSTIPSSLPSSQPSTRPSSIPTKTPSSQPSKQPSDQPSGQPTMQPSDHPSHQPSNYPSSQPSMQPTVSPTKQPNNFPSTQPSAQPTVQPSSRPTRQPSTQPVSNPSAQPTKQPSIQPSSQPSSQPTSMPSVTIETVLSRQEKAPNITMLADASKDFGISIDTKTEIRVRVDLEFEGATVYCGAFQAEEIADWLPSTDVENKIMLQGFSSYTAKAFVTMSLSGLIPSTTYTIYCTTRAATNQLLGIESLLKKKVIVKTACCRIITVALKQSYMYEQDIVLDGIAISTSAKPTYENTAELRLFLSWVIVDNAIISNKSVLKVYPYDVWLIQGKNTSALGNPKATILDEDNRNFLPDGGNITYRLNVTLLGTLAEDYEVLFQNSLSTFVLLSSFSVPPLPQLQRVEFGYDGSFVDMQFDTATNQAGYGTLFTCDRILEFPGMFHAACTWLDSRTIRIFPVANYNPNTNVNNLRLLALGDEVVLKGNVSLRAYCDAARHNPSYCQSWNQVESTIYFVAKPSSGAMKPVVQIATPSVIGKCQSLLVDVTSSSGNGGRSWKSVNITASIVGIDRWPLAELNKFLQNNYSYNPPSSIPARLLEKGYTYLLRVRICNFLDVCGESNKRVSVLNEEGALMPTVYFVGAGSRRTSRKDSVLRLETIAYTELCTGEKVYGNMTYNWTLISADQDLLSTTSRRKLQTTTTTDMTNPTVLALPAFSLQSIGSYEIYVQALNVATGVMNTANVIVQLQPGEVVAAIKGGNTLQMRYDEPTLIDASESYDEDKEIGISGKSAGLSFRWWCVQSKPYFSTNCSTILRLVTSNTTSGIASRVSVPWDGMMSPDGENIVIVGSNVKAVSTTSRITVIVYDPTTSRSSSAYVDVTILDRLPSILTITTDSRTVSKVPDNKPLIIEANVMLRNSLGSNQATWATTDKSIDLGAITLSSLSLPSSNSDPITQQTFNLVLKAGSLAPRSMYTFNLLSSDGAKASISVFTNGPPLPGLFSIAPQKGKELVTLFSLQAEGWIDEDLPLSYAFGFWYGVNIDDNDAGLIVLRSRSEVSYVESVLPGGDINRGSKLSCAVQIFDVYNASAISPQVTLTVDPIVTSLTPSSSEGSTSKNASLQFLIDIFLDPAADKSMNSIEYYERGLAIVPSIMNRVNCSLAPDCSILHREGCGASAHTCGKCLSGYEGDSGDFNTACFSMQNRKLGLGDPCVAHADCSMNNLLHCGGNKTCAYRPKPCFQNCTDSSQGTCTYLYVSTRLPIDTCTMDNILCEAVCRCSGNFTGRGCEYSKEALLQRQAVRSAMVKSISNLIGAAEVTASNVMVWASYISQVAYQPQELTINASLAMLSAIETVMKHGKNMENYYEEVESMLGSLDKIAGNAVIASSSFSSDKSENVGSSIFDISSVFLSILGSNRVYGVPPVSYVFDLFRLGSLINLVDNLQSEGSKIEVPRNEIEQIVGIPGSALSFNPSSTTRRRGRKLAVIDDSSASGQDSYSTSIVQTYQKAFTRDVSTFYSDPMRMILDSSSFDPALFANGQLIDEVLVSIRNNEAVQGFVFGNDSTSNYTLSCAKGDFGLKQYTCPYSRQVQSYQCAGKAGNYEGECPKVMPSCSRLQVYTLQLAVISNCTLLNQTIETMTCLCKVSPPQLSNSNDSLSSGNRLLNDQQKQNPNAKDKDKKAKKDEIVEESGVTDLAAATLFVAMDFRNTFKSANALQESGGEGAWIIITFLSTMWGIGLIAVFGIFLFERYDRKRNKKVYAIEDDDKLDIDETMDAMEVGKVMSATVSKMRKHILQYAESIMPPVFSNDGNFLARTWKEVVAHHPYVHLFTPSTKANDLEDRMLCAMEILTMMMLTMFLDMVFFDLQNPSDDGTCVFYTTELTCLERKTLLDSDVSYCIWMEDTNTCEFAKNNFSQRGLVFVILITSVISTICSYPVTYMLKILVSPSIEKREEEMIELHSSSADDGDDSSTVHNRSDRSFGMEGGLSLKTLGSMKMSASGSRSMSRLSSVKFLDEHNGKKKKKKKSQMGRSMPSQVFLTQESTKQIFHRVKQKPAKITNITLKNSNLDRNSKDPTEDEVEELSSSESELGDLMVGPVPGAEEEYDEQEAERDTDSVSVPDKHVRPQAILSAKSKPSVKRSLTIVDANSKSKIYIDGENEDDDDEAAEDQAILEELCQDVLVRKVIMDDKDRNTKQYEQQWNIAAGVNYEEVLTSNKPKNAFNAATLDAFAGSLKHTKKAVKESVDLFTHVDTSTAGLELLHWFLVDILGQQTKAAIIFRHKFDLDFERARVVTLRAKYISWILLLGLNAFAIYYCILRGFTKGLHWQYKYVVALFSNLAIDIFLFETVDCLWLNYMIPDSVRADVHKAVQVLRMIADNLDYVLNSVVDVDRCRGVDFDAPSYFFVSKRLARLRPNLVESHLVLAYRNHYPGLLCRTWPHYKQLALKVKLDAAEEEAELDLRQRMNLRWVEARKRIGRGGLFFGIISGISAGILYTIQTVGMLPLTYQKIVSRLLQTVILTVLTMLYLTAKKNPLTMVGFGLILGIIGAILFIRTLSKDAVTPETLDHASHQAHDAGHFHNVHPLFGQEDAKQDGRYMSSFDVEPEDPIPSSSSLNPHDHDYQRIINDMVEEEFETMAPTHENDVHANEHENLDHERKGEFW